MKLIMRVILIVVAAGCAAFAANTDAINYDESKVPAYTLPDALTTLNGQRVTDADAWVKIRRPEILELFRTHVYGRSPGKPDSMTFKVIHEDNSVYNGRATRRSVSVCFTSRADGPCMLMHIFIPNKARKPVPVFVGVLIIKDFGKTQGWPMPGYILSELEDGISKYLKTNSASERAAKPTGKLPGKMLPVAILERGYAFASIDPDSIAPDDPETYDSKVIRESSNPDRSKRPPDDWRTISAWSWGLSRALDYFVTDPDIDKTKVIAIGHSRRGKTALWAAAQDERFAMAISNNSGCAGAALSKRIFGETAQLINKQFPHWFCENFRKYDNNEAALPLDQHMLLALIAPRPLYVASAVMDQWADPRGEFLSALNAGPVYALFGLNGLGVSEMPAVNMPVGDMIGYHIRSKGHALTDYDWLRYLDFADRHFKKTATPPKQISPSYK
ncbi:MAG: acetylxylan esterase [bacterium]